VSSTGGNEEKFVRSFPQRNAAWAGASKARGEIVQQDDILVTFG